MTTETRKFPARDERGKVLGTLAVPISTFAHDLLIDQHGTLFRLRLATAAYYQRTRPIEATLHARRKRARR